MTLLVRDEADIIEAFLVYHLNRGVDHVLVIDEGSTDGTTGILDSFQNTGLVTLVPPPPGTYSENEAEWHTLLARQAATEHDAEWIMVGDADEFWWPLWGDLKDVLGSVALDREAVIAPRNDFVFLRPATRNAPLDFHVRERVSALRPKLAVRASPDVAVSRGAHVASVGGKLSGVTETQVGRPLRVSSVAALRIFHFGVRSEAQFQRVGERGKGRAAYRDALYRRVAAERPSSDLSGTWRQEVLAQGLAEGDLVQDHRLADFYECCSDPREQSDPGAPSLPTSAPLTPTQVVDEAMEVQGLIIGPVLQENAKMRARIARLNRAVTKERQARERGPLASSRRALGKLRTAATGANRSRLRRVVTTSPVERGALLRKAEVARWYADNGEDLRLSYSLGPTSRVWDIGGYKGDWAADILARYGCRVDIFEPVGSFARDLRDRFGHDARVTVHKVALGGSGRGAELSRDADSSSLFRASSQREEVRVVDVTEQLAALDPPGCDIDLVKINVEGAEYELLDRLLQTDDIKRFRNLQVQFHPDMPSAWRRMKRIQASLRSTHSVTWQYRFVWENWERR